MGKEISSKGLWSLVRHEKYTMKINLVLGK